jgi:hypothetical protein
MGVHGMLHLTMAHVLSAAQPVDGGTKVVGVASGRSAHIAPAVQDQT